MAARGREVVLSATCVAATRAGCQALWRLGHDQRTNEAVGVGGQTRSQSSRCCHPASPKGAVGHDLELAPTHLQNACRVYGMGLGPGLAERGRVPKLKQAPRLEAVNAMGPRQRCQEKPKTSSSSMSFQRSKRAKWLMLIS